MGNFMFQIDEVKLIERNDDIVHIHFKEGTEITVELQGRLFDFYNDICGDDEKPFLFTADDNVTITKEARENAIIMQDLFPGSASAVMVTSLAQKIIANFFIFVSKPKIPYQVFSKEEEAVDWLKKFM